MYLVNNTENSQAKYTIFYKIKIIAALQKPFSGYSILYKRDIYLYIFFSLSLNLPQREKQLREIQMENIGLAKRLEHTRPVIRSDELVNYRENTEKSQQHASCLE